MAERTPGAEPSRPLQRMNPQSEGFEDEMTEAQAARLAMVSTHQSFAGSADGVGSVGFDDEGAFDVTEATRRAVFGVTEPSKTRAAAAARDTDLGGAPAPNVTPSDEGIEDPREADELRAQARKGR